MTAAVVSRPITESACSGIRADPRTDGDGQALGRVELQRSIGEPRSQSVEDRSELGDLVRGRDDEELVGPVAAPHHRRRELRLEDLGDGQEGAIARRVPVRLVEQAEPVDVDQRGADRVVGGTGGFHGECKQVDELAVVEQPGEAGRDGWPR